MLFQYVIFNRSVPESFTCGDSSQYSERACVFTKICIVFFRLRDDLAVRNSLTIGWDVLRQNSCVNEAPTQPGEAQAGSGYYVRNNLSNSSKLEDFSGWRAALSFTENRLSFRCQVKILESLVMPIMRLKTRDQTRMTLQ